MKVQIRDRSRRPVGVASVDPAQRPTRVRAVATDGSEHEVYLDWERAIDDGGRLRSCIACGCPHVYDLAVLALARTQLACYRCGTVYGRVAIARYHRPWDARTAAEPECQPDPESADSARGAPSTPGNGPSLPSKP
jgi:hypothetical protein